jgi:toxin YoeB
MSRLALSWSSSGWADYLFWQKTDRAVLKRVNVLIEDCLRGDATDGIGKPEPLRHDLSGYWSRRINHEHRLVYSVTDSTGIIISARHHY